MSEEEYDQQAVRDHILVLIDADNIPLRGKTLFMYQMFIAFKEISPELHISFFPYLFGPYSNAVAHEVNWLAENSLVNLSRLGRDWIFELTDKGKDSVQTALENISEKKRNRLVELKKTTHDIGLQATIKFARSQYPLYFTKARV